MSPQTNDLYQALQWHLPWHKARIKFVASFVVALLQVTTVNLTGASAKRGRKTRKKSDVSIFGFSSYFYISEILSYSYWIFLLFRQTPVIICQTAQKVQIGLKRKK